MNTTVTWKHDNAFEGVGNSTGFKVAIGGKAAEGQEPYGASPMELLLLGTAGCTAMDVISILTKKRQDVTAFEIRTHATRATEHPMVFTHITLEYVVTGHNIDRESVKRAIDLSLEKYCSAHAMMSKAVPIEHKFTIIEAGG
jgi:putative redox protein